MSITLTKEEIDDLRKTLDQATAMRDTSKWIGLVVQAITTVNEWQKRVDKETQAPVQSAP